MDHLTELFKPFAGAHGLDFVSFGRNISAQACNLPDYDGTSPSTSGPRSALGTLEISEAWNSALEPAPVTPTDSAAYKLLSGTILATHESAPGISPKRELGQSLHDNSPHGSHDGRKKERMIVAPALIGGNTGSSQSASRSSDRRPLIHLTVCRYSVLLEPHSTYIPFRVHSRVGFKEHPHCERK